MAAVIISDVSTYVVNDEGVEDLDPMFGVITGRRVVAEHIARRLETDPGTLPEDSAYGYNVTRWLGRRMKTAASGASVGVFELQAAVVAQCEMEETVEQGTSRCVATFTEATKAISLAIYIEDSEGPWSFVREIGDVTSRFLLGPDGGLEAAA